MTEREWLERQSKAYVKVEKGSCYMNQEMCVPIAAALEYGKRMAEVCNENERLPYYTENDVAAQQPELKPCPFCGKEPKLLSTYMFSCGREVAQVVCEGSCVAGAIYKHRDKDKRNRAAINSWNTRVKGES